jgi:hypothetical protein
MAAGRLAWAVLRGQGAGCCVRAAAGVPLRPHVWTTGARRPLSLPPTADEGHQQSEEEQRRAEALRRFGPGAGTSRPPRDVAAAGSVDGQAGGKGASNSSEIDPEVLSQWEEYLEW